MEVPQTFVAQSQIDKQSSGTESSRRLTSSSLVLTKVGGVNSGEDYKPSTVAAYPPALLMDAKRGRELDLLKNNGYLLTRWTGHGRISCDCCKTVSHPGNYNKQRLCKKPIRTQSKNKRGKTTLSLVWSQTTQCGANPHPTFSEVGSKRVVSMAGCSNPRQICWGTFFFPLDRSYLYLHCFDWPSVGFGFTTLQS